MHGLGIRIIGSQLDNNPKRFINNLNLVHEIGFDSIEICPEDFDLISCGDLEKNIVMQLKSILSGFNFKISIHAPLSLNLFNRENPELHEKVFESTLELASQIGSGLVVYHPGRYVDNIEFARYGKPSVPDDEKAIMMQYEANAVRHFADCYPEIMIAIENHRSYIDYSPYSYAEFLDELSDQVTNINRDNVGLMIDTGHMFLASQYLNYDFMKVIHDKKIKPVHFHVNDNHGIATFYTEKDKKSQHPFGRGDEHIVPGKGLFPFKEFFANFPDYTGSHVIEITDRFFYPAKIRESYENLRKILQK